MQPVRHVNVSCSHGEKKPGGNRVHLECSHTLCSGFHCETYIGISQYCTHTVACNVMDNIMSCVT